MTDRITVILSSLGGFLLSLLGGWTVQLSVLCVLIVLDYLLGIGTAICGVSTKSEGGRLSSRAGLKGIIKKICILFVVIAAGCADVLFCCDYICKASVIALCFNELISVLENLKAMGIRIPDRLSEVIERRDKK